MIKREKLTKPNILLINEEMWKNELASYLARMHSMSNAPLRYRHQEIKNTLIKETDGKCIYCESKLLHNSFGDIEHIKPKAKFPQNNYDWDNLTLVCQVCNNNKRDEYNDINPPINPYIDDPSKYLFGLGPMIMSKKFNGKGKYTKDLLDLNRNDLMIKRKEAIEKFNNLLVIYLHSNISDSEKQVLLRDIINETDQDKEYSFILKEYLQSRFMECGIEITLKNEK